MKNKVAEAHAYLAKRLAFLVSEGFRVGHLSADYPRAVVSWCEKILRTEEPKERKGHRLSRLDTRRDNDSIRGLRWCAQQYLQEVTRSARVHDQRITDHNNRIRRRQRAEAEATRHKEKSL